MLNIIAVYVVCPEALLCSNCMLRNDNKGNDIDNMLYNKYKLYSELFQCLKCKQDNIPFMRLNNYEFDSFVKKEE